MERKRIWCGLCGTYVYEGSVVPCEAKFNYDTDTILDNCGIMGRPWETVHEDENVTVQENEAQAAFGFDSEPDYDRDTLNAFLAQQEAEAAHEYARDREVIQNIKGASKGALDVQVGGNHYNKLKIQPFEYSLANGLGPAEHTAIKYLTRWKDKGGIKDLDKAIHTIEILKDWAVNNGFS